jgi:putative serine protease PepD
MAGLWPRKRARMTALAVPAVITALAAITACSSAGDDATAHSFRANPSLQVDYERVVRAALPSVVEISAGDRTGSGVVFDSKGDIVTNAHVVGNAKRFTVITSVVSTALKARLIGSFTPDDLAVIKVSQDASQLKPARWADSGKSQVGDIVLAMGSPYGLVDSVTQGIVSATGRTVTGPSIPGKPPTAITDAIQTSAAINPGNSGGALVLLSGLVLGIPTLSAADPDEGGTAEGIGFAIPADTVMDIAGQLIKSGRVTTSDRASLDIDGRTHVGSDGKPDGVTVDTAAAGGASAKAGIHAGDVIVGLGGTAVPTLNELDDHLINYRPGEKVKVELLRNGNPREVMVTLGSLGE